MRNTQRTYVCPGVGHVQFPVNMRGPLVIKNTSTMRPVLHTGGGVRQPGADLLLNKSTASKSPIVRDTGEGRKRGRVTERDRNREREGE